jgi:hypothetical protein
MTATPALRAYYRPTLRSAAAAVSLLDENGQQILDHNLEPISEENQ